jgi:hypothetical protein
VARHFKYWILILLLSYGITIAIHYLFRPVWFDHSDEHTGVTLFEMLFTMILLPVFLVTINYWLAKKYAVRRFFIINAAIIGSCILLSARLHFLNWADSAGSRDKPDPETLEIVAFEQTIGLIITVIGLIIAFVRLYSKRRPQSA